MKMLILVIGFVLISIGMTIAIILLNSTKIRVQLENICWFSGLSMILLGIAMITSNAFD
ncbi:MAG: hypothetical protein K0Q87_1598 [Neobacillus sp.]|jgi:hypothetical protein|nr:hypothetical protein [Neobacillus sp.]